MSFDWHSEGQTFELSLTCVSPYVGRDPRQHIHRYNVLYRREKVWEMKPSSLLALQQIESICLLHVNTKVLVVVDLFNGSAAEVEGDLWEKIAGLSRN